MDPEERRKRHELSYGVYNFRDVKIHFSQQGWTFRPGPQLSYDHYYIKPGKNPRNKQHKRGVDYFLGEAELVAYARKMQIFGKDTAPLPDPTSGGKRRARSSARTSQTTVDMDSDGDGDWRLRREHKRHRRRSNKEGDNAQNPITLSSDSSDEESSVDGNTGDRVDVSSVEEEEDEEWTIEGDTKGGFHQEEDEEVETEELSDEDSPSSSSSSEDETNDEPEDEDLEIAANAKKVGRPSIGKHRSYTEAQDAKREGNGKTIVTAKVEAKPDPRRDDSSTSSSENEGMHHKSPRPLLTTSHKKKRGGVMHTSNRLSTNGVSSQHENKRAVASSQNKRKGLQIRIGKKAKSAPRSVLQSTTIHDQSGGWEDDEDNNFSLDVEEYGESPPRRPPSRVHSRANSVRSSPATSVVAASPPPEFAEEEKEEVPPTSPIPTSTNQAPPCSAQAAEVSATLHSFISPSTSATPIPIISSSTTNAPTTPIIARPKISPSSSTNTVPAPTMIPSVSPTSDVNVTSTSAQVSMELTQVILPPDRDNKYHIRVKVSSDKPPVHTIWMKNLSSHEQRESTFIDVVELPGAKTDLRVPTSTVLTALFRCLSSQPDAVVIVGPEPRATAESKTASEKGEVQLQTSTAEKNAGDGDAGGNGLTLVVAYPALDLFRVDHHFPMKVVSSDQRLQHLANEVERLREQLNLTQTDRDKLCEQLRQQEEENERALSQQVEAQVKARIAAQNTRPQQQPSKEELEQRVAKLVEEKTQAFKQAQEKEERDRDSARRWVFARSDWMVAFQPCRTLMAGATTDTETSLLRPATAASARKYVVEWKEVLEIAEPFFQPTTSGSTRSIIVVKDGVYQVNANVSHDSLVQLRLVITPAEASPREIVPTKVLLYDNKRRVSRVDMVLELRALDQLSLELWLLDVTAAPSQEEWLRTPMPTHNRLLVVVLDEHAVHA